MSIAYAIAQHLKTATNPAKHERWQNVLTSMRSGTVDVGSRKSHKDFPEWATPEVAWGGYATGKMLAGGELATHEQELADELAASARSPSMTTDTNHERQNKTNPTAVAAKRRALVQNFLASTEDGIRVLCYRLHTKCYRIDVPEEGCLMVYAWLCERGFIDDARTLLQTVTPYFDKLRFHPVPLDEPQDLSRVSLMSVSTLQEYAATRADQGNGSALIKSCDVGKTNLLFWDQFIKLWLTTLDDPSTPPTGSLSRDPQRSISPQKFHVDPSCAWPCQAYPENWDLLATELVVFYVAHEDTLSSKLFYVSAINLVRRAIHDRLSLTGRDVARIRWWLASSHVKRGHPGDDRYTQWMNSSIANLEATAKLPSVSDFYDQLGQLITPRVSPGREHFSLGDVNEIIDQMAHKYPGCKFLKPMRRRLSLVTGMMCDELLGSSVVPSAEKMAEAWTTFASVALASQIQDDAGQYLFQQLHLAFARRRSLLLLNYASQVQVNEVPWVTALDRALVASRSKADDASVLHTFMKHTVALSLRRFGERPIRNEFLRVLRTLFQSTGTECAVLEELAADIFMGGFVTKFGKAFEAAQQLLVSTCYDRYYNLSEKPPSQGDNTASGSGFALLCRKRAEETQRVASPRKSGVAYNGTILEQAQILTTHNMSTLLELCDPGTDLSGWEIPTIIRRGLGSILTKLNRIHRQKTPGYAGPTQVGSLVREIGGLWRQMVFWFAVLEKYDSKEHYHAMVDELEATVFGNQGQGTKCQVEAYQVHFRELLVVLRRVGGGPPPDRVVLGWSVRA